MKLNPHVKPHDLTLPGFLPAGQLEWMSTLSELSHIFLFHYDDVALDGEDVLDALRASEKVQAAQLNHYVEDRATPNDPQFGSQWHHIDASDNDIDSDLAWDITTGSSTANGDRIVVAVLEEGLQLQPRRPHWQSLDERCRDRRQRRGRRRQWFCG